MANNTLQRTAFTTDRVMEYLTEKELRMQLGYSTHLWVAVLIKELIDNALDSCENAQITPVIDVYIEPDSFAVGDNGEGLPKAVLERSLDYTVRISDKANYVSPTRGQLGNALKCLWAAPFVIDGECGCVEVSAHGELHKIEVQLDRIAQRPEIKLTSQADAVVKKGTLVKVAWPDLPSYLNAEFFSGSYKGEAQSNVENLIWQFSLFNPHATFTVFGGSSNHHFHLEPAGDETWKKWRTNAPTSPHWYAVERLESLVAGYLLADPKSGKERTVREFVSEFAGLSGTQKQKATTEAAALSGAKLIDLVKDQCIDRQLLNKLLAAMRAESKIIAPSSLGAIGKENFTRKLEDAGISNIQYKKAEGLVDGRVPYTLEVAFGIGGRGVYTGINFSPVLKQPFAFLSYILDDARVDDQDECTLAIHLVCPQVNFTDRGKGLVDLPRTIAEELADKIKAVTKNWTKEKSRADKDNQLKERQLDKLRNQRQAPAISTKDAASQVMKEAYLKASANNTLPANARQIMYAARPLIMELTEKPLDDKYFTQNLLPNFLEEHPELTKNWKVVYDARGHLNEPHCGKRIGLGTLEVEAYTIPEHLYGGILFIEKEGFDPVLEQAQIADKYDLAIFSTKGVSVVAARVLVENASKKGIPTLVLHDFDKAGFVIANTLKTDTRRHKFKTPPRVIDLGLRIEDVEELALPSEPDEYDTKDPKILLRESGATEEECNYLVTGRRGKTWVGKRVELNAMSSDVFIEWLEGKLESHGVKKVVPDAERLNAEYKKAYQEKWIEAKIKEVEAEAQKMLEEARQKAEEEFSQFEVNPPGDLGSTIAERIKGTLERWDEALADIAETDGVIAVEELKADF